MSLPCFYHPELTEHDTHVDLSQAESAHALQARRLGVGSAIKLINGAGLIADGKIISAAKRRVSISIEAVNTVAKASLSLTLAVAMPKGDKQKQLVDSLTQLGVSRLIPLGSEFSISRLTDKHIEKLERVSIEACKQSQNPWRLEITEPQPFTSILDLVNDRRSAFYAEQHGLDGSAIIGTRLGSAEVLMFVGPEGGFSSDELMALESVGAHGINLGPYILRTESAAVAAAAVLRCILMQ